MSDEDETSLDFSRRILPRAKQSRRGEPLPSTMAGTLAMVLGIVNLAAIIGRGPEAIPHLVRKATIVLVEPLNPLTGQGGKMTDGWWFVPETGFWVLAASSLALSTIGIVLSRRRGRPITSLAGFGLNAIVMVVGYGLAFTDYRCWS